MGSVLETIMLICFGFSWPLNLIKTYKSKTSQSTSLAFILLIIAGYIAGITAKIVTHQISYELNAYLQNLAILLLNLMVKYNTKSFKKKTDSKSAQVTPKKCQTR